MSLLPKKNFVLTDRARFQRDQYPTWQYVVLSLLFLCSLVSQLAFSGVILWLQANAQRVSAAPLDLKPFSIEVSQVEPSAYPEGLRKGDLLRTMDGKPVRGLEQFSSIRLQKAPGQKVDLGVERSVGGHPVLKQIRVTLPAYQANWTFSIVLSTFLPLLGLLVGFYIAFARPRDGLAWITMAMLASFGHAVGSGISYLIPSPVRELQFVTHAILSNSWPLWILLFAVYFPIPLPYLKRYRWILWLLAIPPITMTIVDIYAFFQYGNNVRSLGWVATFEGSVHQPLTILYTCYVTAFFVILGWKQRCLPVADARRRLSVMTTGSSVGLLPFLPVLFLHLPQWLNTILLLMIVFFPITIAYVIVVQRAMDVRMVVRSGVRYALASNGIKVLRVILITLLAIFTVKLEQESSHRIEGLVIAAAGVALIVIVGRSATGLRHWMDRKFFREAYDAENILTELGQSIANIRDLKLLLQTVTQKISASLHVDTIAVFLNRNSFYEPAYALGFAGGASIPQLRPDGTMVRIVKQLKSPSRIYFDDPQSWVHSTSEPEQQALKELRTQLLLPLPFNDRLLGLISLGPKKSEAPYSPGDLQLLGAVASQTGLAIENAELNETIRSEIAQRERLDRELEIARDVQQRLFPQKLPVVHGLDFAGYCRPAQGVGGDYYDFVRLPEDCLGIAIGDVSGKGIAAALLMASLQASLRGQTIKPCATLSEMVQHINRLVYDASAENRYATFFYAQYEPAGRTLRYVNAGHNPPVIYRPQGDDQIIRLEVGGTVVGLFPEFPFQEGSVTLQSGDTFVAFTDGISEAMNAQDDEWEEESLIEAVRGNHSRTAADVISDLLEKVESFTAGAKQHDDMTLVVVRVQ